MDTSTKSLYRYPGTKAFEESESKLFKGRDEDIRNMYELIHTQNLIVLYGRSGLGKTSLIKAGLFNKFKEEKNIEPIFVRFGTYLKGSSVSPLQKLTDTITEGNKQASKTFLSEKFSALNRNKLDELWYLIKNKQIADPGKDTFVFIFDQFEELFSYSADELAELKKQLAELFFVKVPQEVRDIMREQLSENDDFLTREETTMLFTPLNIKFVLSIRADKLSLLNNLADQFPSVLKTWYELKPLTPNQARAAIAWPAQIIDAQFITPPFSYTDDCLDKIVTSLTENKKENQVAKNEIETFQLQIVCKFVENIVIETGKTVITSADLGNVNEIFENHYKNTIDKLPEESKEPARRLIEEKLIIDGTRISMPIPFILRDKGMTRELIDTLIKTHIIRPEQNNTIEVSHDTLIEPILKYYDERKQEEAIAEELQHKEEEVKRIQKEQEKDRKRYERQRELDMQKVKNKRLQLAIVVGIVVSIAGISYSLKLHNEKKYTENRRKAYMIMARAKAIAEHDPTLAKPVFDSAADPSLDTTGSVRKTIAQLTDNFTYYTNIITSNSETYVNTSRDGQMIITGSKNGIDSIFDAKRNFKRTFVQNSPLIAASFTMNNKAVLLCSADDTLRVLDVENGGIRSLGSPANGIRKTIYSPYKNCILLNTKAHIAKILDSNGKEIHDLGNNINKSSFSPDGKNIITGAQNGAVTIWNTNGEKIQTFMKWNAPVVALGFSPDSKKIISGNGIGFASIWSAEGGKEPLVTFGGNSGISCVIILKEDIIAKSILAGIGYKSGEIQLWKIKYSNGNINDAPEQNDHKENFVYLYKQLTTLKGHTGEVVSVRMLNDSVLISTAGDGSAKLWNVKKLTK
ncbi:MAG: repeat-containing protein [Flavipsychrobacter sp.]|nr:repeat-containing protein [Flavipsychrobacter sp.]